MSTLRAPLLEVKITALISAIARKSRLHSSFCQAGSSRLALQQGCGCAHQAWPVSQRGPDASMHLTVIAQSAGDLLLDGRQADS